MEAVLVQPIYGLPMFGAYLAAHPDDDLGIKASCIGQHLAQMVMVCWLELVLYHHERVVARDVLGQYVCGKTTDRPFHLNQFQVHLKDLSKPVQVLGQPGRKVPRLIRPD